VPYPSLAIGLSVAVREAGSYETAAFTVAVSEALRSRKLAAVIPTTCSLKVTLMWALTATPYASGAGLQLVTEGFVVSGGGEGVAVGVGSGVGVAVGAGVGVAAGVAVAVGSGGGVAVGVVVAVASGVADGVGSGGGVTVGVGVALSPGAAVTTITEFPAGIGCAAANAGIGASIAAASTRAPRAGMALWPWLGEEGSLEQRA
jgi:hypothetical protein